VAELIRGRGISLGKPGGQMATEWRTVRDWRKELRRAVGKGRRSNAARSTTRVIYREVRDQMWPAP